MSRAAAKIWRASGGTGNSAAVMSVTVCGTFLLWRSLDVVRKSTGDDLTILNLSRLVLTCRRSRPVFKHHHPEEKDSKPRQGPHNAGNPIS